MGVKIKNYIEYIDSLANKLKNFEPLNLSWKDIVIAEELRVKNQFGTVIPAEICLHDNEIYIVNTKLKDYEPQELRETFEEAFDSGYLYKCGCDLCKLLSALEGTISTSDDYGHGERTEAYDYTPSWRLDLGDVYEGALCQNCLDINNVDIAEFSPAALASILWRYDELVRAAQALENSSTISPNPIGEKCDDGWWECAFAFLSTGRSNPTFKTNTDSVESLKEIIFYIGNIIFMLITAFLGVKYIWGGVESKFTVKTSLITLVIAAIAFYGWNATSRVLDVRLLLTGGSAANGYENIASQVYNTIMYVVNVLAIGGIIYIGIKYFMAGAEGKAEMKVKFIPIIMGIIMVYGTLNVISFILDITVNSV